ncbi:MAG: SAM-dependent chlorinase/fluorinase [Flavobacteriales bacterium]|nr:SAM-dependent chlorinase/fluorinase [Flavobacteriales bacterium]
MAIITLTSDFGLKDHHVASMKGAILSELVDANIVDLSHNISPFNLIETAYIVKNAIKNFPKETIHIIAVDAEYSIKNKLIVAKIDEQYFVTADNGILSFIISGTSKNEIFEININEETDNYSIKTLIKTACHIARGGTMSVIGKPFVDIKEQKSAKPSITEDGKKVIGAVIYVDNYGNVITNITRDFFTLAKGNSKSFEIIARNNKWKTIFNKYNEIENFETNDTEIKDGQKLALFNSSGFLELAIYRSSLKTVGGASTLFGLKYHDTITINFD